nr:gastrotropin [Nothobranchius furzeri]
MQTKEVVRGILCIKRERSCFQHLAFPSACLSISATSQPTTTRMAFAGKWEVETQEGYDDFCRLLGIPEDIIEKGRDYKMITEVTQDGNTFSWTHVYPKNAMVTNKFTIGEESDMQTIGGKKFKATVNMEGGKLVASFPNYRQVSEISGGKLVEVATAGTVVLKRVSRKV